MTDFMHSLLFRDNDLNLLCKNGLGSPLAQAGIYEQSMEGFVANTPDQNSLQQANDDLVKKIKTIESDASVVSRVETYFTENQALVLYINKMLLFMYVITYIIFAFGLYTRYGEISALKIGTLLTFFAILPFAVDFISKFLYKRFKEILLFFYRGNTLYLYEPKKMTDTL
jgi:hypothetical protein